MLLALALSVSLLVCDLQANAIEEKSFLNGIKPNGAVWLQFGPAIFSNCKRIDWFRGRPPLHANGKTENQGNWVELDLSKTNKTSIVQTEEKFAPLLSWIKENFADKMNCSPDRPVNSSVETMNGALILYDDVDAKEDNWFCMPHLLTHLMSGKGMYPHVLMIIPLGPDTFSYDLKEEKYRMAQLESLMLDTGPPPALPDPRTKEIIERHIKGNKACGFINRTGRMVFDGGKSDVMDWKFSEGLLTVLRLDGKKEFWNKQGTLAFPASFEQALRFREGVCAVSKNGKWGYIDHNGAFVISPTFDEARSFCDGLAPIRMGKTWGYIRKTGEIAISPRFDYCIDFSDGLAAASKDGKVGFIDKTGNFVIEPKFNQCSSFSAGVAGVIVLEDGIQNRYFIDKTGSKVFDYDSVLKRLSTKYEPVSGGLEPFNHRQVTSGQTEPARKRDALNDYYQNGPSSYEFVEGLLPVWLGNRSAQLKSDGSIAFQFDGENAMHFSEGLSGFSKGEMENKKWGFMDHDGHIVIDAKYDSVKDFSDGLAIVRNAKSNDTHEIIDKSGKSVCRIKGANPDAFVEGLCRVGGSMSVEEELRVINAMPTAGPGSEE